MDDELNVTQIYTQNLNLNLTLKIRLGFLKVFHLPPSET